jgi:hypothetical protein
MGEYTTRKQINYAIDRMPPGGNRWWFEWWTPCFHEGRGPYISIGIGWIRILRGY